HLLEFKQRRREVLRHARTLPLGVVGVNRIGMVHPKPIIGDDPAKLATHAHVQFFLSRGIVGPKDCAGTLLGIGLY
ncbi:MAG: hypothetical protein M3436_02740, partial [Pseudomonadota bacterium]|nr:hypothetical protein [Pseudomonadota bacterium]